MYIYIYTYIYYAWLLPCSQDESVPKLMVRVDAQLKRVLDKEKAMYGKMFN